MSGYATSVQLSRDAVPPDVRLIPSRTAPFLSVQLDGLTIYLPGGITQQCEYARALAQALTEAADLLEATVPKDEEKTEALLGCTAGTNPIGSAPLEGNR